MKNKLSAFSRITILLWGLVTGTHAACLTGLESADLHYQLNITPATLRLVKVQASVVLDEPYLQMDRGGVPRSIPRGWAHFVKDLKIVDAKNQAVAYTWEEGNSRWKLTGKKGAKVTLQYTVELQHDQFDWSAAGGRDARPGILSDSSVFWVTKGLFIFPSGTETGAVIDLLVPEDWSVSTPWLQKEGTTQQFKAASIAALSSNVLLVGKHHQVVIKEDQMSITIAVSQALRHHVELISETLKGILPVYKSIFGHLPQTNYLICVSKGNFEDGEAYYNSFHQIFRDQDLEYRKIIWANVMAHELFHYWNGTNILIGNNVQAHYWFSEGFTEYYANLALIRAKIISKEAFSHKLAYQFSRYFTSKFLFPPPNPNLVEAGFQKNRNWSLLYGGGASVAFVLDVEIRTVTKGKKSLDDFMRNLADNYGSEITLTNDHLLKKLEEISGKKFDSFFEHYILGNQLLPLFQSCRQAGLIPAYYQGEVYLYEDPKFGQKSIFGKIINGR